MTKSNSGPEDPAARGVVLITGSSGNIGAALANALAERYRVVGMDVDCPEDAADVDCIEVDLTSDQDVERAVSTLGESYGRRLEAVIHLAAYFDFSGDDSPLYRQVNVQGTRRLLGALADFEIGRFIYSSTMLVHRPTRPGAPIDEDAPLQAKWPYPQSKLETERAIRDAHGDIPYAILRIAGLYDETTVPPTLAHQIQRIYQRSFESHLFAGDAGHGQSFIHRDDLIDGVLRTIERRDRLPEEAVILLGEPRAPSYRALQEQLGRLIHGEDWETLEMPKPVAKAGAWAQQKAEQIVPDAIDQGRQPFIKPFMVEMADDHYELDIGRAGEWLGWRPRHSLSETLPALIEGLKSDPLAWYRANQLEPPDWLLDMDRHPLSVERLRDEYAERHAAQHRQGRWAHFVNIALGSWLMTSPPLLGYQSTAMVWSDVLSGLLLMIFAALALSPRHVWARWAAGAVGVWLLCAPLLFWAPTAAAYLNDTLVGALVFGFALLVRPAPGVAALARRDPNDLPPGWDYSPSTWTQRLPIIVLAFVGLYVSRYLTAYQLGHIDGVWEPFFLGAPDNGKNGTEEIITSSVSRAWPVPDAGLGALTYMLEILTGILGGRARWRTMPWLVILFGFMIVPLGAVSIFFIIIQPIVIGTWCTLCLIAAAAMLWQIPYSFDEILATCQLLYRRYREGRSLWQVFLRGDTQREQGVDEPEDEFARPPGAVIRDMLGGGVNLPWTLLLSLAIGVWLMFTRLSLGNSGALANAEHFIGALVVTVVIAALAEVARPLRFLNALLGLCLLGAVLLLEGGGSYALPAGLAAGLLLIGLSIPRGRVGHRYAGWNRYIV